ncbi:efflux RND transporter periplasmic adaptor subunit [Scytonema hofmannii]|uniref:efflux RND transporter periplasmic adaptor subunit n=1 Tax=Scytonema hofmannii TaxID=34078 RepID=UPI0009D66DCA|nr:HlyD family efflux transporter periplasmic adaptor subunit [Scytonema hofmannii]
MGQRFESRVEEQGNDTIKPILTQSDSASLIEIESRRKYRAGVKWLMTSTGVVLFGMGGWAVYNYFFHRPVSPVAVSLIPVQRGNVEVTVTEAGTVELGGQQTLKAPQDVTVEQVLVKEGQRVFSGQSLLVLRDREVEQKFPEQLLENRKNEETLIRRQQVVAEKQKTFKDIQMRFRESQQAFERGLIPEFEKLKNAQKRLKRSQELMQLGIIPDRELESNEERVTDARVALRNAEDKLETDKQKVNEALAAVKDAESEQRKAALDTRRGQEKLRELEQQLSDRFLKAPIDGIVLKLEVNSGNGVKTESKLLTLGNPAKEIVRLKLTTLNAAKVRINQVARVSTIGPNPKVFNARVINLSPQATNPTSSGDSGSSFMGSSSGNQTKVDAIVSLDQPSKTLIPGSQVSVEVIQDRRINVLIIPLEVLQTGERPFVWVKDRESRAQKREVTLGLQALTAVEVKSGLREGDRVVQVAPTQTMTPNSPIQETSR